VPTGNSSSPSLQLDLDYDHCTFAALTSDNISKLRTTSNSGVNSFNLTFTVDHSLLYNAGSGQFDFGVADTNESAMPSGRTAGTLTVDGESMTVIPERSFTWYDRQWGPGAPVSGNWTCFELHSPSDVKASIWAWANASPEQHIRFATLQYPDGTAKVVPVTWSLSQTRSWLSPVTGVLYPQAWDITFPGNSTITVSSALSDQEIPSDSLQTCAYEGFVTVGGKFEGEPARAFGLVEMVRLVK